LSLQPHAVCLSQVPSAAKQFSLIESAAQSGNFETCSPHEKFGAQIRHGPRYPQA
jgi:hypothetical protein